MADVGFIRIAAQTVFLTWALDSPQDIFTAFYEGSARAGGLLQRQTPEALKAIRASVPEELDGLRDRWHRPNPYAGIAT